MQIDEPIAHGFADAALELEQKLLTNTIGR